MPDSNRDEIEKLEKLYAANPGGRVFTHLAEAYRKAGDLDRALELLEAGLLEHPDYPSAWVVLGRVKVDRSEADAAGAAFRRVLELDRHNLIAIRALGDLAVEAGRFDQARHYLGELVQIDPADLETAERLERLPDEPMTGFDGELTGLETELEIASEEAWGEVSIEAPTGGGWTVEPARSTESRQVEAPETEWTAFEPAAEPEVADTVEPSVERAPGDGAVDSTQAVDAEAGAAGPGSDRDADAGGEAPMGEAAAPDTAEESGRGTAPLDAWVESLDIMDPEMTLPESSSDLMVDEPEFEAVLEADDSEELEAIVVTPEALESAGGSGTRPEAEPGEWPSAEAGGPEGEGDSDLPGTMAGLTAGLMDLAEPEPDVEPESDPGDWPEPEPEAESESGITVEAPVAEAAAGPDPETTWWGDPEIHAKVPDPVEWVSQEDWERIAAYGAWTGPGEPEGEVEAVPHLETEWDAADRDEDADEVATETLAEVYAAQGFRAEAAEIYRKLLRRRPEDSRLLSRLSALETERVEPAREEAGFEAAEEAGATEAGQAWLEKIESTWPGGEEQPVAGPTPYAWVESGATEPEAGETIGDRLRGLLAWRPESAPAPEPDSEPEPTLLLDEVADDAPRPDFPTFGSVAAGTGAESHGRQDPESDDLEAMFRSWLKSLRT